MTTLPSGGPDYENGSSARGRSRRGYSLVVVAATALATVLVSAAAVGWSLRGINFPAPSEVTSRRVIVLTSADCSKGNTCSSRRST